MRATLDRAIVALVFTASSVIGASTAEAQWYPASQGCGCAQPMAAPIAYNPCPVVQTVQINPCPCLVPVQDTVYREVPVVEYRAEERTVQRPVARTEYVERPITRYRTEYETRTAQVCQMSYQQVSECQQQVVNRSRWQTVYQPIPKMAPCQYDPNPTLLGWMNRTGYSIRSAFTPNYMPRRQFVPNVTVQNIPVTRTVAVPQMQEVAYQVAKLVPYEDTERVAVTRIENVEEKITVQVPYTTTRTVAVGTQTRYAYAPIGGSTGTTPAGSQTAEGNDGMQQVQPRTNPISFPSTNSGNSNPNPAPPANYLETQHTPAETRSYDEPRPVQAARPVSAAQTAGWQPRQSSAPTIASQPVQGPLFTVATTEPETE
jgi:hypothetical protein